MFPYKSTGGLFITKKMKALALIKVDEIYAVSCYNYGGLLRGGCRNGRRYWARGGAACLSKPFAFALRSFVQASPGTGLRATAARFIKKGVIALVHTSSTSAPELAAGAGWL